MIGLVLGAAAAAVAQSAPKIDKGTPYSVARRMLVEAGYRPFRFPGKGAACSTDRKEICKQYPETMSCSGTGYAICSFLFTSKSMKSSVEVLMHPTNQQVHSVHVLNENEVYEATVD